MGGGYWLTISLTAVLLVPTTVKRRAPSLSSLPSFTKAVSIISFIHVGPLASKAQRFQGSRKLFRSTDP